MILCLDVGNSHIFGGLFVQDRLVSTFRRSSTAVSSSDELGIFLRAVLREGGYDPLAVQQVAICSVVPNLLHSLGSACIKYFNRPPFLLQQGVRTGLKIQYKNPVELGADRIANAVAAIQAYPDKNLIILDFGTANTYCAISANKEYLGGVITAGMRISMEALETKTARLPAVEIVKSKRSAARGTVESIQAGLYYGTLGASREIVARLREECFANAAVTVIGTGGFSRLFEETGLFDVVDSDLILQGLYSVWRMNQEQPG
jgi:type III pantothenate kinase